MPINTESEQWSTGRQIDILEVEIERFLRKNSTAAYTPSEITEYLTDEKSAVFPETLLSDESYAASSRLALVTCRLEKLVWHNRVEVRSLDDTLYYTGREDGWFPIAELERTIPNRFIDLEQEMEEIKDELKETQVALQNLEERLPEEF